MKKIISFTVAFGLMASMGAAAFADSATTSTTTTTTSTTTPTTTTTTTPATSTSTNVVAPVLLEPIVKADEGVENPNIPLILTKVTVFYASPNGKALSALAPQIISTTGNRVSDIIGEWVEVYTWLGTAWVHVS